MGKRLFISEKPSVAQEFAKVLKVNGRKQDGYIESEDTIVTWCVGHLVTMSYPESYDPALKKWSFQTLPFLPERFLYEVIPSVKKQYETVQGLLNRPDVDQIYVCTDSGREGEYIYRLVDEMAKVSAQKEKRRVWIDSQTEEEILRGIREAKPLSDYNNLASAAYLRAKEDYLMGINFSRALTLKYGNSITGFLKNGKWSAISVGRVMTCVLGMVVRREREIRDFVETPFYRVIASLTDTGLDPEKENLPVLEGEWRAAEGSRYLDSPLLYKENGFRKEEDAKGLIEALQTSGAEPIVQKVEKKKETKNPPLLYNLAELQNDCSRMFKISPDETLKVVQELYEKKLVTYPRTDARVLSTAVAKEINKNLQGLTKLAGAVPEQNTALQELAGVASEVLNGGSYKTIAKSRYTNDKQITDHYAIIPTGQGLGQLRGLSSLSAKVYQTIVRRFLCIFLPPALYQKLNLVVGIDTESFFASFKLMTDPGYLKVATPKGVGAGAVSGKADKAEKAGEAGDAGSGEDSEESFDTDLIAFAGSLKKGMKLSVKNYEIKEGKTSPPKRYNSGSMILAMENAGQLIEDEELRAQIKGSGIGTSATRAEILNKLVKISYLNLNKKTQIITPTQQGEMVYEVVFSSIRSLLNPDLTASWEKGLTYVAEGTITEEEYMQKLTGFVARLTNGVRGLENQAALRNAFERIALYYKS